MPTSRARRAQELLEEVASIYAGGEMASKDVREMVGAIQANYLYCKEQ
ncbi:MAG: hypothetical protein V8S08_08235 [Lachnoclostridium sp.]